ncbi:MAG: 30S ribosomal protein S12 methylthiotransferase RimO [Victivallales bacterium]|nr:30S ribosomal protein S12 methylthiotransferase RimO [Victivallales bacterium]
MKNESLAVHVISLGCAKNLVDTEVMCGGLVTCGFCLAEEAEDADIVLVNTCGFIRDARKESEDALKAALKWKSRKHGRMVAAAGCLVQREAARLAQDYPGIDVLAGLDDVPRLAELLRKAHATAQRPLPSTTVLPTYLYDEKAPRLTLTPSTFGYVKIAEGCDHRCAFCAIPLIRGRQRSRTIPSILEECRQLLDQGAKELDFIAQDSSSYGSELGDGSSLEKLLQACDKLPGKFWIRVLYTHPRFLTDGLLETLASSEHVLPYLDVPLQHISTPILRAMGRGMDGPATRKLMEDIRAKYPRMTIRTTFLVGFPGETNEDFQELLSFVKNFEFDRMGAFAFSPEQGTPAAKMSNPVPPAVASRRRGQLLSAQQTISLRRNQALVGQEIPVLLEEHLRGRKWLGRTIFDAPEVDQSVEVVATSGRREPGFANIRLNSAGEYGWTGTELPSKQ